MGRLSLLSTWLASWDRLACNTHPIPADVQGPFDVAIFNAVFGNLHYPHEALMRACFLLRPGRCGTAGVAGTSPLKGAGAQPAACLPHSPVLISFLLSCRYLLSPPAVPDPHLTTLLPAFLLSLQLHCGQPCAGAAVARGLPGSQPEAGTARAATGKRTACIAAQLPPQLPLSSLAPAPALLAVSSAMGPQPFKEQHTRPPACIHSHRPPTPASPTSPCAALRSKRTWRRWSMTCRCTWSA